MSAKKITVWNSGGKQGKVVESSALNWADLQRDLTNAGVSYGGMKAVVGKTKVNLEHKDASIPDEDFTLFLFPEKTRSGATAVGLTPAQIEALPYKDLRSKLSELAAADGEEFKGHFNGDKNYTTKTTADLKSLLVTYIKKAGKSPAAPKAAKALPAAPVSKAVAKTDTKPVRASRTAIPEPVVESSLADIKGSLKTDKQKADFIVDLINGMKAGEYEKGLAIDAIAGLVAGGEIKSKGGVSSSAIDASSLQEEARSLARGMSGIKDVY